MNSHTSKLNNRRYIETAHQDRKSRKGFLFFCAHFWHFQKSPVLCRAKGDRKKFLKIPAYSGLRGFVRNRGKFPQITVIFALRGVVGSRGEYRRSFGKIPACGTKGIDGSQHRGSRHFLRASFYHSTKIRLPLLLPLRETCWGVPSPNPAYAAYAA